MHGANRRWWEHCQSTYGGWFTGDVLEVGSLNENGSVREYFPLPRSYIGCDWRGGPGVEIQCLAHELPSHLPQGRKFDLVVSASMLEHDPWWEKSIPTMCSLVRPDGLLLLSWGAALNPPHYHHTATDGCFHALPAGKVLRELRLAKFYVAEFHYEYRLPYLKDGDLNGLDQGCVVLAAFPKENPDFPANLDSLLPEDDV